MRRQLIFILVLIWAALVLASCHPRHASDIRPGMTKEDVVRTWGAKYLIREGKPYETWEYHFATSESICIVTFHEDRVVRANCWRGSVW
jgi:uncharacterized protein (DUF1330 family)